MATPRHSIGILGGLSPESTFRYYRAIIQMHREWFQDHNYPRMVILSVPFQDYLNWQEEGNWEKIRETLQEECSALAEAAAEFALLATNTLHKVLPAIRSPIPVLNVLDAVRASLGEEGLSSVLLMGTKFTMQEGFYAAGLRGRGIEVTLPSEEEQDSLQRIIFDELISGIISEEAAETVSTIGARYPGHTCLLACTELGLLLPSLPPSLIWRDTTLIHATIAWEIATGQRPWPFVSQ